MVLKIRSSPSRHFVVAYKHSHSVLLIGCLSAAYSNVSATEFEISTQLELQTIFNADNGSSQAHQLTIKPDLSVKFDNDMKLTAIGRLRAENITGLKPNDIDRDSFSPVSRPSLINDEVEIELREFFLETEIGKNYLTLGKQQVVWGKADGLKVLDVVNPQSFREFILEDFEESRIPLWMVNYEWQINDDSNLQFLWIPDQSTHALPKQNTSYAFTTPRIVPIAPSGVDIELNPIRRPSNIIDDSDIGLRWTGFVNGWDLTLNYLYHYDDLPVFFQQLNSTSTKPIVTIEPEYKRSHLIGGTFSNAFGDLTVRGELGYSTDKYYLTNNPNNSDGVAKSDELSYVLGFDWFGFKDSLVSFQLFQSAVLDSPKGTIRPDIDTTLTLQVEKEFLNDTLKAEMLILQNLNDGDGLIRPKITYEWKDDLKTWVGMDIFHGDKEGLFGEFDNKDRLVLGLEIGF